MKAGAICNRQVIIAWYDEPVLEAARRMRSAHVGDVVIVEMMEDERIPRAILTDRDIAVSLLAQSGGRLETLLVGDVVARELVTVREEADQSEVLSTMESQGVRRLPVVNAKGGLVGIITFDDLLDLMAEQLSVLARVAKQQQKTESRRKR